MQQENNVKAAIVAAKTPNKVLEVGGVPYTFLKSLGRGGFGKVYLIEKDQEKYALKVVGKSKLSPEDNKRTLLERDVLEESISDFFLGLHKGFENPTAHVFVLEYCLGGDLYQRWCDAGPFDEDTARFYLGEISVAVEQLHQSFYIHRDLKLENVLIKADGHIVLADFGLSKRTYNYMDMDTVGTVSYMAPEMLQEDEEYSVAVDIWAIGIMAFEMMTGLHPFSSNTESTKRRIILEDPEFPIPNRLSKNATLFIKSLLNKDQTKRPYAWEGDSARFAHESYLLRSDLFFKKLNWSKLATRQLKPPFIPIEQGT